jgi:hypothetical protein
MNSVTEPNPAGTINPHVLEVVRSAEQELAGLLQRRAEIMRRVGTIKQMLAGLADLAGHSILSDELRSVLGHGEARHQRGFTQACRLVLMESKAPLTARQSCAELRRRFPELVGHHKDLLASVTTVLYRLVSYAEARYFLDDQGSKAWEWIAEPTGRAQLDTFIGPEETPQLHP